jgi:hypothetical protein
MMKNIVEDIKDISIDLQDDGFTINMMPDDDIKLKMLTIRGEIGSSNGKSPFYIEVSKFKGYYNLVSNYLDKGHPFNIEEVKPTLERIIDYAKSLGMSCELEASIPNHATRSRKFEIKDEFPDIGNPKNVMWVRINFRGSQMIPLTN